ncbi:MAG: LemA family protein [Myxococcales bacterium]|nr:LemA family protein [Myxococcales bacterium]
METERILERLYGIGKKPPRPTLAVRVANALERLQRNSRMTAQRLSRYNMHLTLGALAFACWVGSHVYFYNYLINLEFGVKVAWAQVEASQQKRNHIQRNIRRLLLYYADYERRTMGELTELRTGRRAEPAGQDPTASPPPSAAATQADKSLEDLLGRLSVVAEQYPALQLQQTVDRFSQAVINSETEITQRIMGYNTAVNIYTSALAQFPGRIYGTMLGFELYEFYVPDAEDTLDYREVKL